MKDQDSDGKGGDQPLSPAALEFLRRLEALADVKLGLPITSHREAPIGLLLVMAKKGFRQLFQVFINELMRKQAQFNEALINLSYVTYRDIQSLRSATLAMGNRIGDRIRLLEEAVARLEAKTSIGPKADSTHPSSPNSIHESGEKN